MARTTVVWCPDWPVVASGIDRRRPVAVLGSGRVIAASVPARAEGVARGQRRREAQACCPDLVVVDEDPARDARCFEAVLAAIETVTPLVEILRPGLCAFATRGPSRYHGGDAAMADAVGEAIAAVSVDGIDARVGTADGVFAATLAARRRDPTARLVPVGATPAFLAPLPVSTLVEPDLVDVLERLGIVTLGRLAALDAVDVVGRFGPLGAHAHRLASGLDPRPPDARPIPPDLDVSTEIDPPAERTDRVAFVGKALADSLHDQLSSRGLACSTLAVVAETEHGERLERRWRHEGALGPAAIADRVRWQLEGWLSGSAASRPTGGISRLTLVPEEARAASGRQLDLWGGRATGGDRVARSLARLQATLGSGAVTVPELRGGRDLRSRVVLVPVEAVELGEGGAGEGRSLEGPGPAMGVAAPWPGRIPAPSPATVFAAPVRAELIDDQGQPVTVDGRGEPSAAPRSLSVEGAAAIEVTAWAGPWPVDERWWDPSARRRQARYQAITVDGLARLLALESGQWWVLAVYD